MTRQRFYDELSGLPGKTPVVLFDSTGEATILPQRDAVHEAEACENYIDIASYRTTPDAIYSLLEAGYKPISNNPPRYRPPEPHTIIGNACELNDLRQALSSIAKCVASDIRFEPSPNGSGYILDIKGSKVPVSYDAKFIIQDYTGKFDERDPESL